MGLAVKSGGSWRTCDTSRPHYFKNNGWKPILQLWVKGSQANPADHAWHREPGINITLQSPINIRMNPGDQNNHSTIPIAWDVPGILPPGDQVVVLTDQYGNWLQATAIPGTSRAYTFSGLTQDKYYKVYVVARYPGQPDAWSAEGHWYLGQDPQPYSVAVEGYGGEYRYYPSGGAQFLNCTSYQGGSEPQYTPENVTRGAIFNGQNDGRYWLSGPMPEAYLTTPQGEGMVFRPPTDRRARVAGMQVLPVRNHDVWWGIAYGGQWWGGSQPYSGKYTAYANARYWKAASNTTDTGRALFADAGYNFDTQADPGQQHYILFQRPQSWADAGLSYYRCGCWSVAFFLQDWGIIRYDTYYTAAKNSGYW